MSILNSCSNKCNTQDLDFSPPLPKICIGLCCEICVCGKFGGLKLPLFVCDKTHLYEQPPLSEINAIYIQSSVRHCSYAQCQKENTCAHNKKQ